MLCRLPALPLPLFYHDDPIQSHGWSPGCCSPSKNKQFLDWIGLSPEEGDIIIFPTMDGLKLHFSTHINPASMASYEFKELYYKHNIIPKQTETLHFPKRPSRVVWLINVANFRP